MSYEEDGMTDSWKDLYIPLRNLVMRSLGIRVVADMNIIWRTNINQAAEYLCELENRGSDEY